MRKTIAVFVAIVLISFIGIKTLSVKPQEVLLVRTFNGV